MKRIAAGIAGIAFAAILAYPSADSFAASSSTGTGASGGTLLGSLLTLLGLPDFANLNVGQPNASCEDTPNPPGGSASAPGSAFNPDGTAGKVYAGEQDKNSKNPNSVSQYDVACARPTH